MLKARRKEHAEQLKFPEPREGLPEDPRPFVGAGHAAAAAALQEHLSSRCLLAVIGPLGSGKSAVCRRAANSRWARQWYLHDERGQPVHRRFWVDLEDCSHGAEAEEKVAHAVGRSTFSEALARLSTGRPCLLVLDNADQALGGHDDGDTLARLVACVDRGASVVISRRSMSGISVDRLWTDVIEVAGFGDDAEARQLFDLLAPLHALDMRAAEIVRACDRVPLAINLLSHSASVGDLELARLRVGPGATGPSGVDFALEVSAGMLDAEDRYVWGALSMFPSGLSEGDIMSVLSAVPDVRERAIRLFAAGAAQRCEAGLRVPVALRLSGQTAGIGVGATSELWAGYVRRVQEVVGPVPAMPAALSTSLGVPARAERGERSGRRGREQSANRAGAQAADAWLSRQYATLRKLAARSSLPEATFDLACAGLLIHRSGVVPDNMDRVLVRLLEQAVGTGAPMPDPVETVAEQPAVASTDATVAVSEDVDSDGAADEARLAVGEGEGDGVGFAVGFAVEAVATAGGRVEAAGETGADVDDGGGRVADADPANAASAPAAAPTPAGAADPVPAASLSTEADLVPAAQAAPTPPAASRPAAPPAAPAAAPPPAPIAAGPPAMSIGAARNAQIAAALEDQRRFGTSVLVADTLAGAARRSGDRRAEAEALRQLGRAERFSANYLDAEAHLAESRQLFEALDDGVGQGSAFFELGQVDLDMGRLDEAEAHLDQALALFHANGRPVGEANASLDLVRVDLARGHTDRAESRLFDAMDRYEAAGDRLGFANACLQLGQVELARGKLDRAERHFGGALDGYEQSGDKVGFANACLQLGQVELGRGRIDAAERRFTGALVGYEQVGDKVGTANASMQLGQIDLARNRLESASGRLGDALAAYEQMGDRIGVANASLLLGQADLGRGELDEAEPRLIAARSAYDDIGDRMGSANSRHLEATLLEKQGRRSHAMALFGEAARLYSSLGRTASAGWSLAGASRTCTGKAERMGYAADAVRHLEEAGLADAAVRLANELAEPEPLPEPEPEPEPEPAPVAVDAAAEELPSDPEPLFEPWPRQLVEPTAAVVSTPEESVPAAAAPPAETEFGAALVEALVEALEPPPAPAAEPPPDVLDPEAPDSPEFAVAPEALPELADEAVAEDEGNVLSAGVIRQLDLSLPAAPSIEEDVGGDEPGADSGRKLRFRWVRRKDRQPEPPTLPGFGP